MNLKSFFCLIICLCSIGLTNIQAERHNLPYKMLEKDYPKLMDKFGDELKLQRANYIFAIDVSGTMNKYEQIVVPAMSQFVESLSEGDNVNIIRFGTDSKVSMGGLGDIDSNTKQSLQQYIKTLYKKDVDLYSYTDLNRLLAEFDKQLKIQKNNLTFIFVLTDFVNDPAPGKEKLSEKLCELHRQHLKARSVDHSMYMYALQLPVDGRNDLVLFKKAIPENYHFEEFAITSSSALKYWFDRKKTEILLDKFKAVVERKLHDLNVSSAIDVDIDGNVKLEITWEPNELFDAISIDTVWVDSESNDFSLITEEKMCHDSPQFFMEAGQIAHVLKGFHSFVGNLHAVGSVPTDYENELDKLEIKRPKVEISKKVDDIIFTFPIPLWLLALLIFLFMVYVVLVIRAACRNLSNSWKINGRIYVDYRGKEVADCPIYAEREVGVGCEGKPVVVIGNNCDWQLTFFQQTFCCLLLKKPVYKVTMNKGDGFETETGPYMKDDIVKVSKGEFVMIGDYTVSWIE